MAALPQCYAVRLLNPFRGVLEIVETERARALSRDGLHWEIQVEAERPEHTWGRDAPGRAVTQYFRFGDWQPGRGLSRVPLNPILDIGAILDAGEALADHLEQAVTRLPFPFADSLEYWQLDSEGRPLVLLASTAKEAHVARVAVARWCAAAPGERPFPAAAELEQKLRDLAGPEPLRRWYRRGTDGRGQALGPAQPDLPTSAFPGLPVRPRVPNPDADALLDAYLQWLAPDLLPLDTLDDDERRRLERAACRQARQLEQVHRLIPRVLQPELVTAARVEARLRGQQPPP